MRFLYTAGGFSDPRKYDENYARNNFDFLKGTMNDFMRDAYSQGQGYYYNRGFGNGIESPGTRSAIMRPFLDSANSQMLNIWNMSNNDARAWAGNTRSNNADWINQRNAEYAWDAEEERIKQRQQNAQWQNSFGGQLMGVLSAAAPIAGAVMGGPAGYMIGQGVAQGANSIGGNNGGGSSTAGNPGWLNNYNLYGGYTYATGGIPNKGKPALLVDAASGEVTGTMNERAPEVIVPLDKMEKKQLAEIFAPKRKRGALYEFPGAEKLAPAYDGAGGVSAVPGSYLLPEDDAALAEEIYREYAPKFNKYNIRRKIDDLSGELPNTKLGALADLNPLAVIAKTVSKIRGNTSRSKDLFPDDPKNLTKENVAEAVNAWKKQHPIQAVFMSDKNIGENILNYYYGEKWGPPAAPAGAPPASDGTAGGADVAGAGTAGATAGADAAGAETGGYRNPYAGLDYSGLDTMKRPEYRREAPRQTQDWVDVFAAAMSAYAPYHTAQMNQYANVGARSPLEGAANAITGHRQRVKAEEAQARAESRQEASDEWQRNWQVYSADRTAETDKLNREIERVKYDNTITEKERAERLKVIELALKKREAEIKNNKGLDISDKEFDGWYDYKKHWWEKTNGEKFIQENQQAIFDYLKSIKVDPATATDVQQRAAVKAAMKAKP
jgi:hypothetical protein